jgi:hypothetical protein
MSFEIYLRQQIANEVGRKVVTVESLTVENGYIQVNNYFVPLVNILFVKQIE